MIRYSSFLLHVLLFAVLLATAALAFDTNDDVASFFQTSGYLTGIPDGRLIFSHRWLGDTLAWLYRTLPGPNWYVWYLYAALLLPNIGITKLLTEHLVSTDAIYHVTKIGSVEVSSPTKEVVTSQKRSFFEMSPLRKLRDDTSKNLNWRFLIGTEILSITIGWNMLFFCTALLRPQYTVASMWLGAAGWFWLFCKLPFREHAKESSNKAQTNIFTSLWQDKRLYQHLIIGAVLLLASALVRWHAFFGISVLLVPVLGCYTARRNCLTWFGFAGIIGLLLYLNDGINQQKQPLETSMAYQTAIDAVVNGPNNLDSITISNKQFTINDLKLLQQWFWIDKVVFSPEKIVELSKGIRQWRTPLQSLRHLASTLYDNWPSVLVWLIAGLGLWQCAPKYRQKQLLWAGLWLFVWLLALAFTSRTPFRVIFPFVALFMAAMSLTCRPAWVQLRWPLIVLLVFIQAYTLYSCHRLNRACIIDFQKNSIYLRDHSTTLFVARGDAFPFEGSFSWWYDPRQRRNNLLPTGYLIHTPLYNDILRQWNIDNLAPALLRRTDIQVIDPPTGTLQQFYLEKYQYNYPVSF